MLTIRKETVLFPLFAHVPHSSTHIPTEIRESVVLDDDALRKELLKLTDRYVDDLFSCVHEDGGISVIFGLSRLVVDPERFEDDSQEEMSSKGMGVIYTKTSTGHELRPTPSEDARDKLLDRFYRPYHLAVENQVQLLL